MVTTMTIAAQYFMIPNTKKIPNIECENTPRNLLVCIIRKKQVLSQWSSLVEQVPSTIVVDQIIHKTDACETNNHGLLPEI